MAGNTFEPIDLDALDLSSEMPVREYAKKLYTELKRVKKLRAEFYEEVRKEHKTVLAVRKLLIGLGIIALLATAFTAAVKLTQIGKGLSPDPADVGLGIALIAYALMTALSFWESAAANSSAYFRSTDIILALRDLWSQYEFDQQAILAKLPGSDETAIKAELLATARALAAAMDTLARTELGEWRGEVQTSLTQLAAAGKEGLTAVQAQLKAEYDERLAKLEEAAKPKPKSYVTLQLKGALDGPAELTIDDKQTIRTAERQIALPELTPEPHSIKVVGKDKQGQPLSGAKWIDCKAGIVSEDIQVA